MPTGPFPQANNLVNPGPFWGSAYTPSSAPGPFDDCATIDGFEDGGISEYSGDTGNFTVSTSPVESGSYALKRPSGNSDGIIHRPYAVCGGGSSDAIQRGYSFEVSLWAAGSSTASVLFPYVDADNYYRLTIYPEGDDIYITSVYLGSSTELANVNYTHSVETWQRLGIDYGDTASDTITVYAPDGSELFSVTNTDHTDGGIGWEASSGVTKYECNYDDARYVSAVP